jgi:hypothetical protein
VTTVAALYVMPRGPYAGLEGVELWDEARDARLYDGPWPVVAHPPCSRWCQLAHVVQARYGHRVGDDGGCFEAALSAVRKWGGVLEHPAYTLAWPAFDLPRPPRRGWLRTMCGGFVCAVSQAAYGHRARKMTWLYAYGVEPVSLDWSRPNASALVSYMRNHGHYAGDQRERLTKNEAKATPPAFRDVLLSIARSAKTLQRSCSD